MSDEDRRGDLLTGWCPGVADEMMVGGWRPTEAAEVSAVCLGIPGRIVEIVGEDDLVRVGTVDFGGVRKEVSLAYVPEATLDDYVIVHVGFAITLVDEEEAQRTLEVLRAMGDAVEAELGTALPPPPVAAAAGEPGP